MNRIRTTKKYQQTDWEGNQLNLNTSNINLSIDNVSEEPITQQKVKEEVKEIPHDETLYPTHVKTDRERKFYDQAMGKGWAYDTRIPNRYFFTQDHLDKELEQQGFEQTTHYGGRKLSSDGLLTLDQLKGDRMTFSYDKDGKSYYVDSDVNNRMMKMINSGDWGYNPSTGSMIKLNEPTVHQLTATEHLMDTEEFGRLTQGFGSSGN